MYMTATQIADELQLSVRQARGLILARLPHVRVARNEFRVDRKDFDEYLKKNTAPPIYKS